MQFSSKDIVDGLFLLLMILITADILVVVAKGGSIQLSLHPPAPNLIEGELAAIVPLEIDLTQVEGDRWMAEVLAMPGVYANAASKQEAIEDIRVATLCALVNLQADHKA